MNQNILKILFTLFISSSTIFAQNKIDLDDYPISVNKLVLPLSKDLQDLKTISGIVFCKPITISKLGISGNFISENLSFFGFENVSTNGDLEMEIEIKDLNVISETIESKVVETKDKAKVVTSKTVYFIKSTIIAPTSLQITNIKTGNLVYNESFVTASNPYVGNSTDYPTYDDAKAYLSGGFEKRIEIFKNTYKTIFKGKMDYFKQIHDYSITKKLIRVWEFDLNKNPEFAEYNKKLKEVKTILSNAKGYEDLKTLRASVKPFEDYCMINNAKIVGNDKRNKKIKYAYLTNIMRFQSYLEQFRKSDSTARMLIDNDFDKVDGKVILNENKIYQDLMKRANLTTSFVYRESFESKLKFNQINFEEKIEMFKFPNPPYGFKAYPGYVINFNREKIEGEVWAKNLNDFNLLQANKSGAKFVYEKNGKAESFNLSTKMLDEVCLGRDFIISRYKFKNSYGVSEKELYFRKYYENKKVVLLNYYKSAEDFNSLNESKMSLVMTGRGDFCIMNKTTQVIEPVASLFANSKATEYTAEYYKNCPELSAKIKRGEFGNLTDMKNQVRIANYFQNDCK